MWPLHTHSREKTARRREAELVTAPVGRLADTMKNGLTVGWPIRRLSTRPSAARNFVLERAPPEHFSGQGKRAHHTRERHGTRVWFRVCERGVRGRGAGVGSVRGSSRGRMASRVERMR
jgi:hypothetical protein